MRFVLLLPVLLLAACGGSPNDPGVGGVTRAEADALNDAAEMLDQPDPPPSVVDDEGEGDEPAAARPKK